jgi:transcriptional regulator with XRE-family HTH domain
VPQSRKKAKKKGEQTPARTLGWRLKRARGERSLMSVAEPAKITAAYLQKLERDTVKRPSPNILYALSEELELPYDELMESAGYVVPRGDAERVKQDNVLTYALSSEKLTDEEAAQLLEYLDWYRHSRPPNE